MQIKKLIWFGFGLGALATAAFSTTTCELAIKPVAKYGSNNAWRLDDALVYSTHRLNVDADGAPESYRMDGKGLSDICDGLDVINNGKRISARDYGYAKCHLAWNAARDSKDYRNVHIYGFLTDKFGAPVIQGAGDPQHGNAYISTTSVTIGDAPPGTQRHYVDAMSIPYLVLPGDFRRNQGVRDAAVAAVYRPKTDAVAFAVFGDTGGSLDEASVRLHADLGGKPLESKGGVLQARRNIDDEVIVVFFPSKVAKPRLDSDAWRAEINAVGKAALDAWGGEARLKACGHQSEGADAVRPDKGH
jgi:hypothetical protein